MTWVRTNDNEPDNLRQERPKKGGRFAQRRPWGEVFEESAKMRRGRSDRRLDPNSTSQYFLKEKYSLFDYIALLKLAPIVIVEIIIFIPLKAFDFLTEGQ